MFWNASNEKDQIHTSQEHVFSVNNILKATGSLLFMLHNSKPHRIAILVVATTPEMLHGI